MLIKCPECGNEISDKAICCMRCGCPVNEAIQHPVLSKPRPKSKKRMRLPNGFGRITEIKGKNLRKPYRVMISYGKDENGRPIGKLLKPEAYFETYNDAYAALVKYHENPYDYENTITLDRLFERWFEKYEKTVSESRGYQVNSAYSYCSSIIGKSFVKDLRTPDIRRMLDDPYRIIKGQKRTPGVSTKKMLKDVLAMMFDYAVEYGFTDHNYVRDIRSGVGDLTASNPHICYSDEEMKKFWDNEGMNAYLDMTIVQCYTGWRPTELVTIDITKINMTDWYMEGGSKTDSGKDRIVPIHTKIRPLVMKWYQNSMKYNCPYLFGDGKRPITYDKVRTGYKNIVKDLGLNPAHRPHDGRKQFVTMAKDADMDEYAIKLIVGHHIADITERVYTERNITWLHKEMAKIK